MTAPNGGRWIFSITGQPVVLGFNNGSAPVFPLPQPGAFNIEVFTNPAGSGVPNPEPGFQSSIADPGGTLDNAFLTGTKLVLGSGDFLVVDSVTGSSRQSGSYITLGSGNQTVVGAQNDTIQGSVNPTSASQILSALAGRQTVIGGTANNASIWGGANSLISAGTGTNQQIVVTGSGTTVNGGLLGNATISTAAQDTIFGGTPGLFGGGSGNMVIAAGQQNFIQLFNFGHNVVIGASGDTIVTGGISNGSTDIDGSAGAMLIQVGGLLTNVSGSTSTVAGNTVLGFGGSLNFNPGPTAGAGDLIDFSNSGPGNNATINAFAFGTTRIAAPDTIIAGSGNDSVFAGAGDRVGISGTAVNLGETVGGTHQWVHAETVPGAAVGFGTFDSVAASSRAEVTVSGFNTASDFIFYQHVNAFTTNQIIATSEATAVNGTPSTNLFLPDGTVMTLVGVTQAQLTPVLFKP